MPRSRPIPRKSGYPPVELQLPRKPAGTLTNHNALNRLKPVNNRFKPVRTGLNRFIITVYGNDFRKYDYNSKLSKLNASFCVQSSVEQHLLQEAIVLNGKFILVLWLVATARCYPVRSGPFCPKLG